MFKVKKHSELRTNCVPHISEKDCSRKNIDVKTLVESRTCLIASS